MRIEMIAEHWLCLVVTGWLGLVCGALWYRTRAQALERRRERLLREELEAYARLDATLAPGGDARALAKQICRMVAEKSAFRKAALLLRNTEGQLYVAGSSGMDDLAVAALTSWGVRVGEQERAAVANPGWRHGLPERRVAGVRLGPKSFVLDMTSQDVAPREELGVRPLRRMTLEDIRGRAILLPLRTAAGYMAGALAVSVEAEMPLWTPALEEAVPPLETLAVKLARTMENAALTARLVQVERLAVLGQLTSRVAHELNNPLTAVLGFGELIAATSSETRVRDDARTIVAQALRMREMIENLVRPEVLAEGVSSGLVQEAKV